MTNTTMQKQNIKLHDTVQQIQESFFLLQSHHIQLQTSIYIIKYSFTITNHIACTNLKRFMRDLYSIKYNIFKTIKYYIYTITNGIKKLFLLSKIVYQVLATILKTFSLLNKNTNLSASYKKLKFALKCSLYLLKRHKSWKENNYSHFCFLFICSYK